MSTADFPTLSIGGDLPVHRLGFGAMHLTSGRAWGPPADRAAAVRLVREAVDRGVTFIDTADSYGLGANEELLAEALHPYPEGVVVATKAGQSRPAEDRWVPLGRPEYLRQQAELSLRRLRRDTLDLFQLHRVDPHVPLEEQVGALADLRAAGKVRHIGLSEVGVGELTRARAVVPIASVQNLYHLGDRRHDDVLAACEAAGTAFVAWRPLPRDPRVRAAAAAVAAECGATPTQVALAWLLNRSPVLLPIPGTRSLDHLVENVGAAALTLTAGQRRRLDAAADLAVPAA
ncbi:MAG TPA: aldo/keto reductase [Pilimelia sp.]|nr:aldo/keto reductase [Pilimelia sp.]